MSAEHRDMIEKAFYECKKFDNLLGVYTGACSTLYLNPDEVFDTERATELMDAFKARLQELMFHENKYAIDTRPVDQFINRFFRSE